MKTEKLLAIEREKDRETADVVFEREKARNVKTKTEKKMWLEGL